MRIYIIIIWLTLLFVSMAGCAHSKPEDKNALKGTQPTDTTLTEYCNLFQTLNVKIRDSKIAQQEALKQLKVLLPQIKKAYYKQGGRDYADSLCVFPLASYNLKAVGGNNGSGYAENKYNFFDGNKHFGHPAQDIFIHDSNFDGLDDATKKPVEVLSMTGGVVVDTYSSWDTLSKLRGGNYIWVYDPFSNSLYYYAHNSKVLVQTGDIIKPGDIIANVGRTGLNAYKHRSPTHLHMMQLKMDSGSFPRPYNFYQKLIKAKVTKQDI